MYIFINKKQIFKKKKKKEGSNIKSIPLGYVSEGEEMVVQGVSIKLAPLYYNNGGQFYWPTMYLILNDVLSFIVTSIILNQTIFSSITFQKMDTEKLSSAQISWLLWVTRITKYANTVRPANFSTKDGFLYNFIQIWYAELKYRVSNYRVWVL